MASTPNTCPPRIPDVLYSEWRELDSRLADGGTLNVALMWRPDRGRRVSLVVDDARRHRGFVVTVDGADALLAFNHPMAFAPEGW